jgi:hypothetical protein
VRQRRAGDAAENLRRQIDREVGDGQFPPDDENQTDGRINVGAGHGSKNRDEHDENRCCGQRVGEERERRVVCQPLGHDAGADDSDCQQKSA